MTKDKGQKRAVRARMAKTGERYTTARLYALDLHQELAQHDSAPVALDEQPGVAAELANLSVFPVAPAASDEAPALPPRQAEPGMSEAAILRGTGKSWDEWFALLDAWGGTAHNHTEIARHVAAAYGVDGWWAQGVTVGYERARGMRALYERPDGFSMNVSKTFPVPIAQLFAALLAEDERERWLDGMTLRLRTSVPNKSARFDVSPADVRLMAYFTDKGPAKSSVALQMERLPSAEEVARWKEIWKEQLAHLATYLAKER